MPKLRALPAALVIAIGLTACGGGGGGSSDNAAASASSSGVLVDDLVVDAGVFCDSNSNGRLDSGEAQTTTDDRGVYSFSPACTAPVVSVADTGYDKTTLKAPRWAFRAHAHSAVMSPFTTMHHLAGNLTAAQFRAVLVKLGLDVDATTFNPATDNTLGPRAAAVVKVLNEIAEIVASAGGDPAVAFEAAAAAMVEYARTASSSGSLLDNDSHLDLLIKAAADAGFAGVTAWTPTAQARAAELARTGLLILVKAIKGHARYSDIHDNFNNGAVNGIISETDLDDDTAFDLARGRCRDNANVGRAQYVYASDDRFTLVGPGLAGGSTGYTLAQFDAGIDLTGHSLGSLTRLELPLQATTLALPKNGSRVALALEVEEVGGGNRVLQVLIDRLVLKRDKTTGVVSASISDKSELFFYARSASGIEIGTGKNAFENLDASLLTSGGSGVALDLQVLAARMKGKFPTQTDLLDKLLAATGTFKVRLVVNELDLRHADGSRFGLRKIAVRIPGEPNRTAERITGTAVLGQLTF